MARLHVAGAAVLAAVFLGGCAHAGAAAGPRPSSSADGTASSSVGSTEVPSDREGAGPSDSAATSTVSCPKWEPDQPYPTQCGIPLTGVVVGPAKSVTASPTPAGPPQAGP